MHKLIVVVFRMRPRLMRARAFKKLHEEGSLTIYAGTVITKAADGKVMEKVAEKPFGMGVGALLGGLVGSIAGGPVALVIRE